MATTTKDFQRNGRPTAGGNVIRPATIIEPEPAVATAKGCTPETSDDYRRQFDALATDRIPEYNPRRRHRGLAKMEAMLLASHGASPGKLVAVEWERLCELVRLLPVIGATEAAAKFTPDQFERVKAVLEANPALPAGAVVRLAHVKRATALHIVRKIRGEGV